MQVLLLIPLLIAVVFGAVTALLRTCGVAVQMSDPVTAGAIAVIAGIVGAVFPLRREGDLVATMYAALIGTVVHLLACIALTIGAIAFHVVDGRGKFIFWMLGGYWISMFGVIWLARRVVINKALKAQH